MEIKILVVEQNINLFNRVKYLWLKYGFTPVLVSSMQEAIEQVTNETYVLIGINADTVNYLPMLPVLRNVTSIYISIRTDRYRLEDELIAIKAGANDYCQWLPIHKDNYERLTVILQRHLECLQSKRNLATKYILYESFFIYPHQRKVFLKDREIELTRKEYELLKLLVADPNRVFTYTQLIRSIWGDEYVDGSNNLLVSAIKRLRKKIKPYSDINYIQNVHDVGYSFDR